MLVGSTGSGKSTLVDGIANYFPGVSFEDPFRFKIVTLEKDETTKKDNQVKNSETNYTHSLQIDIGKNVKYFAVSI